MNSSKPMLLVDGNNLLMRAFYAGQKSGMSHDGVHTGPLLIFINTLAKHIREEQPSCVAVAWDGGRSEKRIALDGDYKGTREFAPNLHEFRESVFSLAHEFCTLAGVYQQHRPGVEADDIIASWWQHAVPDQSYPAFDAITILSSDKDFLQLVGLSPWGVPTTVVRLSSGGTTTDRWDEERVTTTLGCPPSAWPFVTALVGDRVDNVPGVPGIGPKRASALLGAHEWDLEATLTHPRLIAHVEQIRKSLQLVDLRTPSVVAEPPPPRWRPTRSTDLGWGQLTGFLGLYGLSSVKQKLTSETLWSPSAELPVGRRLRAR